MPDREPDVEQLLGGATLRWYAGDESGATVVVWPAMGVPARKYRRFAQQLSATGPTVVLADYRGQEESSRSFKDGAFSYSDIAGGDLLPVVQQVKCRRPEAPVVVMGHSVGGQLATVLEHEYSGSYDGLVLIATGTPDFREYTGRRKIAGIVGPPLMVAAARVRGVLDANRLGFGVQHHEFLTDWARMARTGSWRKGGHTLSGRRFPLLAISFDNDDLSPAGTLDALVAHYPDAQITRVHGISPDGHSRWVREPDEVIAQVSAWLREAAFSNETIG